ncbi:hypothetical protein RJ55_01544 [Drechmeria coniospora]|nr:hypothetical protein RJ55_01544 [Drechmeria coniospora]
MVFLSTTMDALLLAFLSLPNPYLYVQFAPVAYIVKLHIELTMASLIGKVVQSDNNDLDTSYVDESRITRTDSHSNYVPFPSRSGGTAGSRRASAQSRLAGNQGDVHAGSSNPYLHLGMCPEEDSVSISREDTTAAVVTENDMERGEAGCNDGGNIPGSPKAETSSGTCRPPTTDTKSVTGHSTKGEEGEKAE